MRSITIFTEGYPDKNEDLLFKAELKYIVKKFDEVVICYFDKRDIELRWYKGESNHKMSTSIRLSSILKNHWKLILGVLMFEYKQTIEKSYLTRSFHYVKTIVYAVKRAYDLNNLLPTSTIFYSDSYSDWSLNIAMLKRLYRNSAQWTISIDGYDGDLRQLHGGLHQFRNWNNLYVNSILTISDYWSSVFSKENPILADKIVIGRLVISNQVFARIPCGKAYTIVSCSRIIPLKRVDKLARILYYLNRRIIWVHFGNGPDLISLQRCLANLPENIGYILKGSLPNSEIQGYYKNEEVDLFINTSELEINPYSMIEAASHGIPLAGFNICGIPEIIDKNTGVLFDEGSSDEANAEKLKSFLISGLSRNENYRTAIQSRIRDKFSAKKNSNNLLKSFEINE